MKKVEEDILRVLYSFKATEQKARERNQPEGLACIQSRVEGYRMGLKTCLKAELVDGLFSKAGF